MPTLCNSSYLQLSSDNTDTKTNYSGGCYVRNFDMHYLPPSPWNSPGNRYCCIQLRDEASWDLMKLLNLSKVCRTITLTWPILVQRSTFSHNTPQIPDLFSIWDRLNCNENFWGFLKRTRERIVWCWWQIVYSLITECVRSIIMATRIHTTGLYHGCLNKMQAITFQIC